MSVSISNMVVRLQSHLHPFVYRFIIKDSSELVQNVNYVVLNNCIRFLCVSECVRACEHTELTELRL